MLLSKTSNKVKPVSSFRLLWLIAGLLVIALLAGCSGQQPTADVAVDETDTPAEATALPTSTVAPTAEPRPFGEFSLGWKGLTYDTCTLAEETTTFQTATLNQGEFIYFVSPFEPADVGNSIQWKVIRPDGSNAYDARSKIYDSANFCFWQGIMLANEDPGTYKLEIVDWNNNATSFDLTLE